MFNSVLIANRGEIAVRIARTAKAMGVKTIAVYSDADAQALHVKSADEAVRIGPAPAAQSYLNTEAVLEAARASGAEAIHPGYGFLSENADFAREVANRGMVWIGPSPEIIDAMGDKVSARNLMAAAGIPVARGTREAVHTTAQALTASEAIGFPLMVKAAAGGGGIGMSAVHGQEELASAFETATTRAQRFFGDPAILLEQLISPARHIEVQILGLADGRVIALGERECSVQRRHQKVLEETPSPGISPAQREKIVTAAIKAGETMQYKGAGTVEFLFAPVTGEFVFLEVNTRLQVEHPITELVHGVDLVQAQLLIAAGKDPGFDLAETSGSGHAIEMRVYAEDPVHFIPSPGTIDEWSFPTTPNLRVDTGYLQGDTVSPYYDPMLAKVCVWGDTREEALQTAREVIADARISGVKTNLPLFERLLKNSEITDGSYDTDVVTRALRG